MHQWPAQHLCRQLRKCRHPLSWLPSWRRLRQCWTRGWFPSLWTYWTDGWKWSAMFPTLFPENNNKVIARQKWGKIEKVMFMFLHVVAFLRQHPRRQSRRLSWRCWLAACRPSTSCSPASPRSRQWTASCRWRWTDSGRSELFQKRRQEPLLWGLTRWQWPSGKPRSWWGTFWRNRFKACISLLHFHLAVASSSLGWAARPCMPA